MTESRSSSPLSIWRIGVDAPDYEAHDLTGKGGALTGGRWNRKGTPMVYASTSRALACLETVVHLGGSVPLPLNRYLVEIHIPATAWSARCIFQPADNVGWDALPAGKASLDWGTSWANDVRSLLAEVPSVIVPEESNILINPRHPGLASLSAVKLRRWSYDTRLSSGVRS